MSRLIANAAAVAAGVLLPIVVLEVGLRLWPAAISPAVLANFKSPLRRELAARLDLPLKQARRCIAPAERSDHGPELCLIAPNMQYRQPVDRGDVAAGAQTVLPHDPRGFCNPPAKAERPRATLVTLGDSFTWCTVVAPEATFSALLEPALGVTTYDLGVPGVGPYEYLEILRRFGLDLEPRIVLLNIYEGNDLRDAERFEEQRVRFAARQSPREPERVALHKALLRRSYAGNFLAGAIEYLVDRWRPQELDFRYQIEVRGARVTMNRGQADRDEVRYARRLLAGEIGLSLWDRALADFAALAAEHGFVPVVTYIPAAYTANALTVAFADPTIGQDLAAMSLAQRDYLAEWCAAYGLMWIDLTEPIQAALANSDLAYFPYNRHLTPAGHAIVAAALAPRLRELLASPTEAEQASR